MELITQWMNRAFLSAFHGSDMEAAIHTEYRKGTEGLSQHDFHFIRQGRDNVMSLSAADKQGWLWGIQLARDSHVTAPPAH
jgi:hypothetical protein